MNKFYLDRRIEQLCNLYYPEETHKRVMAAKEAIGTWLAGYGPVVYDMNLPQLALAWEASDERKQLEDAI